ncbi:MAG: enoyl-CoA hydratase/isomerase family protein [Alphaproteobacteria bacterium]
MAGLLITDKSNGVGKVLLNRPEAGNALTPALLDALVALLHDFSRDPAVRSVLVTGIGKTFCAGDDREALARDGQAAYQAAIQAFIDCQKPIVCAPRGDSFDTGLELALASDFRIASDTARFAATWVGAGIAPPLTKSLLPAAIGTGRAADCLLRGTIITADEAARIGLVHQTVPDADLKTVATALAETLAAVDPKTLAALKSLLR